MRIGCFKRLVVELQRRPPIGSPHCASQNVHADLVIGDAPVRVGCPGDRSSLGSARSEDPSARQTCPPGDPWRAGHCQAASGDQAQPAGTRPSEIQAIYDSLWANAREKICTWGPAGNPKTPAFTSFTSSTNLRYRVGEPVSEAVPSRGFRALSATSHKA